MLFLALALAVAAKADAPPPSSEAEQIVITGQRMKRLRVETKTDRKTGVQRCVVKRTSGDPALDGAMCEAVLACAKTARKSAEMEGCMRPRMEAMARTPARQSGTVR
jgi:hypothetical protein